MTHLKLWASLTQNQLKMKTPILQGKNTSLKNSDKDNNSLILKFNNRNFD